MQSTTWPDSNSVEAVCSQNMAEDNAVGIGWEFVMNFCFEILYFEMLYYYFLSFKRENVMER